MPSALVSSLVRRVVLGLALLALLPAVQGQSCAPPARCHACSPRDASETIALLEFKATLTGARELADWKNGSLAWTGVCCADDTDLVTELDLSMRHLEGPVDWAALARLQNLQSLVLNSNKLVGALGAQLSPRLAKFEATDNLLEGKLPESWRLPLCLLKLDLSRNRLTGTLPATWPLGALGALGGLHLSGNYLNGTLPPELQLPPTLTRMDLQGNKFVGTLPEWSNKPTLQVRVLPQRWEAGFCGEVPAFPRFMDASTNSVVQSLPPCRASSLLRYMGIGMAIMAAAAAFGLVVYFARKLCKTEGWEPLDTQITIPRGDSMATVFLEESPLAPSLPLFEIKSYLFDFNEIELIQMVGEGFYAQVHVAKWREAIVAVKVFKVGGDAGDAVLTLSHPTLDILRKEARLLGALKHPHVVAFLGACLAPPCLISEYCQKGSLLQVLEHAAAARDPASFLKWEIRLRMLLDAAKGLAYLHMHSPPVIHRDLKSANLLVCDNWRVKVGDFGLSKALGVDAQRSQVITQPRWLAPELLQGQASTTRSDIYAFGIIMYECLMLQFPWRGGTTWEITAGVIAGQRPAVPDDHAQLPGGAFQGLGAFLSLMQRCWAQEPTDRPDITQVNEELRRMLLAEVQGRRTFQVAQEQPRGL